MWKSLIRTFIPLIRNENLLPTTENIIRQQIRRRTPPALTRKGYPLKKLRTRNYIYELVKDTNIEKKPNLEVILTSYVDGLGNAGDRVSVKPLYAYENLLLPGLAVYPTPENLDKYKDVEVKDTIHYSSPRAFLTMQALSRITLSIIMNKDSSWILQPWHIRTSFRKCGFMVPEYAITMPQKEIRGADLNIEGKEFFITVTINNTEKVKVKCKVHHWSTDIKERLPYVEGFWKQPGELLFQEDAEKSKTEPNNNI